MEGEAIEHGRIYIAPPDHHMLVERARVRIVRCPKENRVRPAVAPLFRLAACAYGPRVVGVAQDALYPGMPSSALENVPVDYCRPLRNTPK
jgi:two-component system, chemotaxis family, protein-glutamate methylesterase/glutaminase